MKRILLLAALFAVLGAEAQLPAEIRLDKRSLRPRYREWARPAGGVRGVDRIVPMGKTMDFDLIWDGYDLVSRLTRTVSMI